MYCSVILDFLDLWHLFLNRKNITAFRKDCVIKNVFRNWKCNFKILVLGTQAKLKPLILGIFLQSSTKCEVNTKKALVYLMGFYLRLHEYTGYMIYT